MKVVFLCGGVGKRMFPITEDKFLINFMGVTLFEHQVTMARGAGLKDFIVIANPSNVDRIKQLASKISGANFAFTVQKQPLGIADALMSAAPLLDGEILIVNPNDVFQETAYQALLKAYALQSAGSYMLGYEVKQYFPGGYLAVDGKGYLTRIVEKPEPGTEPGNLVNILLHLHTDSAKLFKYIAAVKTVRDDVYECAMDNMVRDGYGIKVVPYKGFWAPIKYPWHIFDIVKLLLDASESKISPSVSVSDRATIAGKVIIGENVRILENAVVRGPVYIGPNTIVGNNALIREYSHIGADCVVGFSTEIKGSYIGNDCWFHSNYIGDSIVGNGCSFGAGTVTANFRFDEKVVKVKYASDAFTTGRDHFGAIIGDNCKMGINSGILPGRRMGPNSIVGSHVCLENDLEPGMTALGKQDYKLVKHGIELDTAKKLEQKKHLAK
jgi:UDP-N-acetylglucosamine diphosphorylase / glucose-1-phosphate thymidylyltransferase / UDP-N-acetylgalactosamine diphosphorylase / glucosamine-1-phosphate N-acetyltransferase / galactosamine-1-phosphate N-acetyltransferase